MPTDNEPMFEKFAQFKIFEKSNFRNGEKKDLLAYEVYSSFSCECWVVEREA
jgi:hypothetical protein